jgi:peptidoglycan/xylan/chitin deacetylase (PgdA/CDA1 family)
MKQTILKLARLCGLFALSRRLTRGQLRILCYHGIWIGDAPHFGDCLFMRPDTFAGRLDLLARAGYPVLGLADALEQLDKGTLPDAAVVITIDDAWYGITRHMLPALTKRRLPATLYVTTYYSLAQRPVLNVLINFMIARARSLPSLDTLLPGPDPQPDTAQRADYASALAARVAALATLDVRWDAVRDIASQIGVDLAPIESGRWFHLMNEDELRAAQAAGIDIQLHTHTHRMHDFDGERVRNEVVHNRRELARLLAVPPATLSHFCYPSGVHAPTVYPVLKAAGVRSATTTDFGLNPPGSNPYALKRILDCQSMSELELEARLSGFWSLLMGLRDRIRPRTT